MKKVALLITVIVLLMTPSTLAIIQWSDDFESYANQTAFEVEWPADPLVGGAVPLELTTEANHTVGGSKSPKSVDPYQSSRHTFASNLGSGTLEYWFYDPGYNPSHYPTLYIDARAGGAYTTFGINRDTGLADTNYFYYLSDVGWQNPFTGPVRTQGWHQVLITFGTPVGGSLYFDGIRLGDNSDMSYGCTDIGLGTNHWSSNPDIYFDDISYDDQVYTAPECGDWGYHVADINEDCYVDIKDFVKLAQQWLMNIEEGY